MRSLRLTVAVVLTVLACAGTAQARSETESTTYVGAGPALCSEVGVSYAGGCFAVPAGATSVNVDVTDPLDQRQLSELAFYGQGPDQVTGQPAGDPIQTQEFCGEAYQQPVPSGAVTMVVRIKTINESEGVMACPVVPTTGEIHVEFRIP